MKQEYSKNCIWNETVQTDISKTDARKKLPKTLKI